jgi:NADH:ubiquinone reductase (H+-translocating)
MRHRSEPQARGHPGAGDRPVVLVIGCGFGGLATLRELSGRFRVTVLDRNIYTTFQPLLYQVATAGVLSLGLAAVP